AHSLASLRGKPRVAADGAPSRVKRIDLQSSGKPGSVDEYIAAFSPEVRRVLKRVRRVVRAAAPEAEEVISYRMPALKQDGVLVYFAAFKNHIGLYPPVKGDPDIEIGRA